MTCRRPWTSWLSGNKVDKYSWSFEVCLQPYLTEYIESKLIRLHVHAALERNIAPFRGKTLCDSLAVGGIQPSHVAGCSDPTSGRKSKGTGAMHYYNQMPKTGKNAAAPITKPTRLAW